MTDKLTMTANRDFVLSVIHAYKELPSLWKTTDPDYRDKVKRNLALDRLVELFKTVDPGATMEVVKKKINSMRGSFRKELNKVRASEKSATKDLHVPKLWYYNELLFLEDQEVPWPSRSVYSLPDDMPFGYDEGEVDDTVETESRASETSASTSRPTTPQGNYKRRRSKANRILDKIAKRMDQVTEVSKEKYASFGEHVAEKLRSMPPEMVPICQKIISDAIFYGETKNLNMTSRIVTESADPAFPQHPSLENTHPQG